MPKFTLTKMQKCNWEIINCSPQIKGLLKQLSHLLKELLRWISKSHQTKQFCKWCSVKAVKIRDKEQIQWKIQEIITSQNIKEWTNSPERCLVRTLMIQEEIHKLDSNRQSCLLPNTLITFWRGLLEIQTLSNILILTNQILRNTLLLTEIIE